jgi:hypothetical protein
VVSAAGRSAGPGASAQTNVASADGKSIAASQSPHRLTPGRRWLYATSAIVTTPPAAAARKRFASVRPIATSGAQRPSPIVDPVQIRWRRSPARARAPFQHTPVACSSSLITSVCRRTLPASQSSLHTVASDGGSAARARTIEVVLQAMCPLRSAGGASRYQSALRRREPAREV